MIKRGLIHWGLCSTLLACQAGRAPVGRTPAAERTFPPAVLVDKVQVTPSSQPAQPASTRPIALRAIAFVPNYDHFYGPLPQSLCAISADRRLVCFPDPLPWLALKHPVDQLARQGNRLCAWSKQGETTCFVKRQRSQFSWPNPGRRLLTQRGLCEIESSGRLQCRRVDGAPIPARQLSADQLRYLSRDKLSCAKTAGQDLRCSESVVQHGHKLSAVVGASARLWSRTPLFPAGFFRGHHCGCDASKQIWCWGDGYLGQRGDRRAGEDIAHSEIPSQVPLAKPAEQLAVSGASSCALTSEGAVYCWGEATRGAVPADGALTLSRCPVDESATRRAFEHYLKQAHKQYQACMTRDCGRGLDCQLGCVPPDRKRIPEHVNAYSHRQRCMRASPQSILAKVQLRPTRVPLKQRVIQLIGSDGTNLFCALLADGSVRCWGETHPKYGMSLAADGRIRLKTRQ
ncbi:MAG: hypothetical protein H6707_04185 [Deltaproteobacteria bacterium]|nr:hypothetical protein [Deltaproteobacteria bacterium]